MTLSSNFLSTKLLILLALVAMLTLSFISFTRISRMNELSSEVNHANLIRLNLQETYSDLSDADSELSKYILTSDSLYKERMLVLEEKIQNSIQELKVLSTNNPEQLKRLVSLENLIQKRLALMTEELKAEDKDFKKITSAITECNSQIILLIDTMKEAENSGLVEMEQAVEKYKWWTPVMIFAFQITVILFLVFAYLRTDQEFKIKLGLQNELQNQVQFIRAVLDNSVDLILVLDEELNLLVANKKASEVLGVSETMIGKNIFSLFPMSVNSPSHGAIMNALNGKYVHIERHRAQAIDRILESFFIPLHKGDSVTAVIIIHHDISSLIKAFDELEVANEQLIKSNEALEQFAYVASHDLQEPLRKISAYSEFAGRTKDDPEKLSGYITKISDAAERMANLIKDVLTYSRVSSQTSGMKSVDLNLIYRKVIQDLELVIEEKQANISSVLLPFVYGNEIQLSQVFFNLLHNAMKFSDKSPLISITCRTENGFYIIQFMDNGIGFDQSYADQIFEVFKRVPHKQTYSGSGIGLAVCKKIMNNHGGSISVQSETGKGTTFEIQLPIPSIPIMVSTTR